MYRLSEVFWTVLAGVSVFVVGQLLLRLVVDPILAFRRLRGEIAHSLIYYANVYGDLANGESQREAMATFRDQAARLKADVHTIFIYGIWSFLGVLPKESDVNEASRNLIGLANDVVSLPSSPGTDPSRREEKIRILRRIKKD